MVILVTMETVIFFGSKYKTVWNIGNFSNSRNIDHLATLTQVWHQGGKNWFKCDNLQLFNKMQIM